MSDDHSFLLKQAPLADSIEWQDTGESSSRENQESNSEDDAGISLKNDEESDEGGTAFTYLQKYSLSDNVSERQNAVRHLVKTLQTVEDDENSVQSVFYIAQRTFAEDSDPIIRAELLEQIPLLAMHCAQCQKLASYKSTILLPLLVKFLNDSNTQVRKTCQAAVSILLEQGLLTADDIEHCLFPVLLRLSVKDYNAEDIRIESAGLLCKLVPSLGREKTISLFLTRYTELCLDSLFHIRKTCATYLGEMSKTLGPELTERIMVPHLMALSQDTVWGVRKASAECITDVSGFCSMQTRRNLLAPVFIVLLADSSRWVQSSAFQALGPFISTFADSNRTGLQWVDGQLVYDEHKLNNNTSEEQSATDYYTPFYSTPNIVLPNSTYTNSNSGVLSHPCSYTTSSSSSDDNSVVVAIGGDDDDVGMSDLRKNLTIVNSNIAQLARQRLSEENDEQMETLSSANVIRTVVSDSLSADNDRNVSTSQHVRPPPCQDETSGLDNLQQHQESTASVSNVNDIVKDATQQNRTPLSVVENTGKKISLSTDDTVPLFSSSPNSDDDFETTYTSFKFWQPSLPESLPPLAAVDKNDANLPEPFSATGGGDRNVDQRSEDDQSVVQNFMERHLRFSGGAVTSPTDDIVRPAPQQTLDDSRQSENFSAGGSTPSLSLSFEKDAYDDGGGGGYSSSTSYIFSKIRPRVESDFDESESDLKYTSSSMGKYNSSNDTSDDPLKDFDYQDIIPQALLDQFLSMVEPARAQAVESDISRHCAFNFPAVAYTIGRKHWPLIKPTYLALANEMQWKVRRTLAFSIHNLAAILGPEITVKDLLPVFTGFLRDLDEVRIGILKHLYDFLKLLDKDVRAKLLVSLADFLQTDNYRNWRFRHLFAEQLILLCELFDIEHINDYLSPIAMTLAIDKVAEIRQVTHRLLATILYYFYRAELEQSSSDQIDSAFPITDSFVQDIIKGFAKSQRWIRRQTFLYVCHEIIRSEALPPAKFASDIVPALLTLSQDTIPNVRIVLANVLSWCLNSTHYFDALPDVEETLEDVMKRLVDDKDRDVRHFVVKYAAAAIYKHLPDTQHLSRNQQKSISTDSPSRIKPS